MPPQQEPAPYDRPTPGRYVLPNKKDACEKSEKLFLKAFHSSPDAFFIINPADLAFVYFNDAACNLLGYSREELMEKKQTDIKPNFSAVQIKQKLDQFAEQAGSFGVIETVFRKKNGTLIDIQAHITAITSDENEVFIVETARDVTRQLKISYEFIKNEEKYGNLFNYLPNVMLRTTHGSIIRIITPACLPLLGYTPEELQGKPFADLYTCKKDRELFIKQLNENGKVTDFQLRLTCKNGSVKTVSINAQYYRNHENEIEGIEGVLTDITKLVQTTVDINATKEFFEKTLNAISADIAVYDEDDRYCFLNEHAVKDKVLRQSLIGKTNYDYCRYRNKGSELADTRQRHLEKLSREGGKMEWIEEMRRTDGSCDYMLRIMEPFETKDKRKYKVGYGISITALKNAEKNLTQLITHAPSGIVVIDPEGIIELWNPMNETIFGWPEEEMIGQDIRLLIQQGDVHEFDLLLQKIAYDRGSTESSASFEFMASNKRGERLFIVLHLSRLVQSDRKGFIVFLEDVTERTLAIQALNKREKQLNEAQQIASLTSFEWNHANSSISWSDTYKSLFHVKNATEIATIPGLLNNIHPGDRRLVEKAVNNFLAGEDLPPLEFRTITPTGEIKYLVANAVRSFDITGADNFVFGTVQDISSAKLFERKLFKAIMDSEERERHRIAAELHDGVCQDLAAVKLTLSMVLKMMDIKPALAKDLLLQSYDILENALLLTSRVSHDLLPADTKEGLVASIEGLVARMETVDTMKYCLEITGNLIEPDPQIAINLYRIIQEFIRNSQKHSSADNLQISLHFAPGKLQVTVADDGKGFDVNNVRNSGIGFINMAKRVETIGGHFNLASQPMEGVTLYLSVPL